MNKKIIYTLSTVTMLFAAACSGNKNELPGVDDGDETAVPVKVTVIEYMPAPGQFVNELPEAEPGDSYAEVLEEANEDIADGVPVSLGAFGGYIVMKTEAPVAGRFRIVGNAISNGSEPGIVSVSADGKEWFDIAGEHFDEVKEVTVTYKRPEAGSPDDKYIAYTVSDGTSGYIPYIPAFHTQPYFPLWIDGESISFTAKMLPRNTELIGTEYKFTPYKGYADSYPNSSEESVLDLKDAVDGSGAHVELESFSYVKVTTAILSVNGRLGELSTEVAGIERIVVK